MSLDSDLAIGSGVADNRHTSRLILHDLRWRGLISVTAERGRRLGLNGNLTIGSSMANERNSSGLGLNSDLAIGSSMANEGNFSRLSLEGDLAIGGGMANNDLGRKCLD